MYKTSCLFLLLLAFNIINFSRAKKKSIITAKIIRPLLRGRQKLKLPANKTQIQKQSTFGKPGHLELRSSSQLQAIQKGISQTQIQSQIILTEDARAEHQSQVQRSLGYKKQVQMQSQYNLGGKKGRLFESKSENQIGLNLIQYQSQRQSFDTSKYDEQSQSISRNTDSFQGQNQDISSDKTKSISSTKKQSHEKLEPNLKHHQYQKQWTGGSFSHSN